MMKSRFVNVVIILTFFLQINAREHTLSSVTCGSQSNDQSPWHVAVYHIGLLSWGSPTSDLQVKSPQYTCSGTLINMDTVLTAAHCVRRYYQSLNRENVLVSLKKQNLSEPSSSGFLKVVNLIQHPNYSHKDLRNDIAIIKLSAEVTFDNHVQPICLWDSNRTDLSEVMGKLGKVVGWKRTEKESLPDTLQQAIMPVVHSLTCLESDRRTFGAFISKNTFCAGFRQSTSPCISDTGGSMIFEKNGISYIRGVVSIFKFAKTGDTCDPNEYTIFTDVAKYLMWITEVAAWKCEKRVSCVWFDGIDDCLIHLNSTSVEQNCKVIAENALEKPDYKLSRFKMTGNIEALPDLTNIFDLFKDIFLLIVKNEAKSKLTIERKQLLAARRIGMLNLEGNGIEEIAPDTFDDLSQLVEVDLKDNRLKVIHRDTFMTVYRLRTVFLQRNDLESLPEGLFRNNRELGMAVFNSNKLKIIETDFRVLPNIFAVYLNGNECINEDYDDGLSSHNLTEFQAEIWKQCNRVKVF